MGKFIYVKIGDFELPRFKFDTNEREEIENALKKFDKNKVSPFISFVEQEIRATYFSILKSPSRKDNRLRLDSLLRVLEKTDKELKWLANRGPFIPRRFDPDTAILGNENAEVSVLCEKVRSMIKTLMEKIRKAAEFDQKRKGPSMETKKDLAFRIAYTYKAFFGKRPSASEGGAYFSILGVAFKTCGLDGNPVRAGKAALKMLHEKEK